MTFDHSLSEQITLFRAKASHEFEFKVKKKIRRTYSRKNFGALTMKDLSTLYLCSMKSTSPASEDGFYHIEDSYVLNKV